MREIILSSGETCLVDDEDYEFLNQWRWKGIKSKSNVYAGRNVRGKNGKKWACILMHRLLTDAPSDLQVDHIDGDQLNNCKDNLRLCTQSQNNANSNGSSRRKYSQYKGVTRWTDGTYKYWQARIKKDGVTRGLGYFKDEALAAKEYDRAAIDLYGEFAKTNFPREDYS